MRKTLFQVMIIILFISCENRKNTPGHVVIQTDFGIKDGAVAAMKGVAYDVAPDLILADLTHEIPAFNVWEAAYRLNQVVPFWPSNTVFVSVVDPGVGTDRRSIVLKTKKGHFIVSPDNGTTTLIAGTEGIDAVRIIDEKINRRKGSDSSFTFHGRDVYMFTAARLASGVISFAEVGPLFNEPLHTIDYQQAVIENGWLKGNIPVLDIQYGNVWTNISDTLIKSAGIKSGDSLHVQVSVKDSLVYSGVIPFVNTFGDVSEGKPLAYINSLMNFSMAINMGNFAASHKISSGPDWSVQIKLK